MKYHFIDTRGEGLFFVKIAGKWVETNHWPKGKTRARIATVKDGTISEPFGDYTLNEARAKVAEFIEVETKKDHGYERFIIVPQSSNEMTPEVKARLRKLAAERKKPVEETVEAPAAEAFVRNEKKRERAERKSYNRKGLK